MEAIVEGHHFMNMFALRAPFLLVNFIAKAKKPFTIGEEQILSATKDNCHELLGDTSKGGTCSSFS